MKTVRAALAAIAVLVLGLSVGCVSTPPPAGEAQTVAIEEVIAQVQQALSGVQNALATRMFPPLKEVRLTLQTVATRKVGGTVKLWVVSAGAVTERTRTQQIVLTLVPPAGHRSLTQSESLAPELEAAILSAAEGVEKARTGAVPLVASALDVEINFTVKNSGTAGANVVIAPVTAGLNGELSSSTVQTIKVSFAMR